MSDSDNLEFNLKHKLKIGEITQEEFDDFMLKFKKLGLISDVIPQKKIITKLNIDGSKDIDGGVVEGPVIVSGRLNVDGNLECNRLSISGSTNVYGNLRVFYKSSLSGELNVDGNAEFLGPVSITGTLKVDQIITSADNFSISGNMTVNDDFKLGAELKIYGQLKARNVKCAGKINVIGVLKADSVLAEEFSFHPKVSGEPMDSQISGDLRASKIIISTKLLANLHETLNLSKITDSLTELKMSIGDAESATSLKRLVDGLVENFIPKVLDEVSTKTEGLLDIINTVGTVFTPKSKFIIRGNIEGKSVKVANVTVHGDIIGDTIFIGPGVEVHGKIKYRKEINIKEGSDYQIEKIN